METVARVAGCLAVAIKSEVRVHFCHSNYSSGQLLFIAFQAARINLEVDGRVASQQPIGTICDVFRAID